MTNTYTIPVDSIEKVEKEIRRIKGKAEKYGTSIDISWGTPYTKERSCFVHNPDYTVSEISKETIEVVDVTINGEEVKKGDYQVIAAIEHGDKGNIVHTFTDTYRKEWSCVEGKCDHCHTNHRRVHTFIVRGADGEHQVGRSCLRDYCGIDPHAVGYSNAVCDIFLDEERWEHDFISCNPVYDTIAVIALAQKICERQGYVKAEYANSNRDVLIYSVHDNVTTSEYEAAKAIANVISSVDGNDNLVSNIQNAIRDGYCKKSAFGYLAYAPVLHDKIVTRLAREEEKRNQRDAEAERSDYVGDIGQRIVVDIKAMNLVTSWPTQFGTTYLYRMIDTSDNVLVWFASTASDTFSRAKVTIKDHDTRDGVKQTIVTRCKAC